MTQILSIYSKYGWAKIILVEEGLEPKLENHGTSKK
jgi:hypothetical protein